MRKVDIKIYKFEELTEKTQLKIIEEYNFNFMYDELYNVMEDEIIYQLENEELILETDTLRIFYDLDENWLKFYAKLKWKDSFFIDVCYSIVEKSDNINAYDVKITDEKGESCSKSMYETILDKLKKIKKLALEIGQAEYAVMQTIEWHKERCDANEYEFYADGRYYNE